MLDPKTIAFADYAGTRQYITWGNLMDNPKAHLFLIDYTTRQRVKLWGRAEMVEDATLTARLMPEGYRARPERALIFHLDAWEASCSQHISLRIDAAATRQRRPASSPPKTPASPNWRLRWPSKGEGGGGTWAVYGWSKSALS